MATLIFSSHHSSGDQSAPSVMRLREWLDGRWGILYSNPEDFAPHPSTPHGFIASMCGEFEQHDVKPITVGSGIGAVSQSWLDLAVEDDSLVIVDADVDAAVIDLAERALAMRLAKLAGPFVMILDAHGRCRATISYRPRRIDRPRTLADILNVVEVLRGGAQNLAAQAV